MYPEMLVIFLSEKSSLTIPLKLFLFGYVPFSFFFN